METTYNGYANWATWYVKMNFFDDDEERMLDLVREALIEGQYAQRALANALENDAQDIVDSDTVQNSPVQELAEWAIEQVDYWHLAEIYLDCYREAAEEAAEYDAAEMEDDEDSEEL